MKVNLPSDGTPVSWIVGYGWNHAQMGRLPTATDLDEICADIPVVLKRICLHICAVNTLALRVGKKLIGRHSYLTKNHMPMGPSN